MSITWKWVWNHMWNSALKTLKALALFLPKLRWKLWGRIGCCFWTRYILTLAKTCLSPNNCLILVQGLGLCPWSWCSWNPTGPKSLFRVMSFTVFRDRKCHNCQLQIRESDSYLEQLCAVHRPNLNVIDVMHSIEESYYLLLNETFALLWGLT